MAVNPPAAVAVAVAQHNPDQQQADNSGVRIRTVFLAQILKNGHQVSSSGNDQAVVLTIDDFQTASDVHVKQTMTIARAFEDRSLFLRIIGYATAVGLIGAVGYALGKDSASSVSGGNSIFSYAPKYVSRPSNTENGEEVGGLLKNAGEAFSAIGSGLSSVGTKILNLEISGPSFRVKHAAAGTCLIAAGLAAGCAIGHIYQNWGNNWNNFRNTIRNWTGF